MSVSARTRIAALAITTIASIGLIIAPTHAAPTGKQAEKVEYEVDISGSNKETNLNFKFVIPLGSWSGLVSGGNTPTPKPTATATSTPTATATSTPTATATATATATSAPTSTATATATATPTASGTATPTPTATTTPTIPPTCWPFIELPWLWDWVDCDNANSEWDFVTGLYPWFRAIVG